MSNAWQKYVCLYRSEMNNNLPYQSMKTKMKGEEETHWTILIDLLINTTNGIKSVQTEVDWWRVCVCVFMCVRACLCPTIQQQKPLFYVFFWSDQRTFSTDHHRRHRNAIQFQNNNLIFFLSLFICIQVYLDIKQARDKTTKEGEKKKIVWSLNYNPWVVDLGGSSPEINVNWTFLFKLTAG